GSGDRHYSWRDDLNGYSSFNCFGNYSRKCTGRWTHHGFLDSTHYFISDFLRNYFYGYSKGCKVVFYLHGEGSTLPLYICTGHGVFRFIFGGIGRSRTDHRSILSWTGFKWFDSAFIGPDESYRVSRKLPIYTLLSN